MLYILKNLQFHINLLKMPKLWHFHPKSLHVQQTSTCFKGIKFPNRHLENFWPCLNRIWKRIFVIANNRSNIGGYSRELFYFSIFLTWFCEKNVRLVISMNACQWEQIDCKMHDKARCSAEVIQAVILYTLTKEALLPVAVTRQTMAWTLWIPICQNNIEMQNCSGVNAVFRCSLPFLISEPLHWLDIYSTHFTNLVRINQ